ncbi:MAG: ABC transporter ATP-binding protein [Desulfohalobiaceae bacterium]|nr:ABC transporter ATP-binding protein [Desulfohalobiaceae bacterium]
MLNVQEVESYYGEFQALRDLTFDVPEGKIVALLGPNAAGKTTTLRTISGEVQCRRGEVSYAGQRIDGLKPEKIVDMGISQVPEGRKLFNSMTVRENLELGAYTKRARTSLRKNLEKTYHIFPILYERSNLLAGHLSGGEQQMCAIARGLMSNPKLLMIDEMSLGLSPVLVKQMFDMVRTISTTGVTILLVEQQVNYALKISDFVYIMENGTIILSGPAREISGNEHVKKAYLGI